VCVKLKIDDVFILRFWMLQLLIRIKKTEVQRYFCAFINNHSGVGVIIYFYRFLYHSCNNTKFGILFII